MREPQYQPDVNAMANDLARAHGGGALDIALETARQHMKAAAWKHCTMWLQVVNRLNDHDRARAN